MDVFRDYGAKLDQIVEGEEPEEGVQKFLNEITGLALNVEHYHEGLEGAVGKYLSEHFGENSIDRHLEDYLQGR